MESEGRLKAHPLTLAVGALCVTAALSSCQDAGLSRLTIRVSHNPIVAEGGAEVRLSIDAAHRSLIDPRTVIWDAEGGTFREEKGTLEKFDVVWIAPWRPGTYSIRFIARGREGQRIEGAAQVSVKSFGQPPSRGCRIACGNVYRDYARKDQIPALYNPPALKASEAHWIGGDWPVAGVEVGGMSRAYPLYVLANHEVVNDLLGGERITVSFSPLAGHIAVFKDEQGGFGHVGALYESFHILYDRASGSEWIPALYECVSGPLVGKRLAPVPFVIARWDAWKGLKPETTVVWPAFADPERVRYDLDPYAWYERDNRYIVGILSYHDLRLPRKERVLGLKHGGKARAYPLKALGGVAVLNEELNGLLFVVIAKADAGLYTALWRLIDGKPLDFALVDNGGDLARFMKDTGTGSIWNALGEAVEGPLAGKRLELVYPHLGFFFAWSAIRQGSEIWGGR